MNSHGTPAVSLTVGDGLVNPLGFSSASPVFSWKLPEGVEQQSAYRIEVKSRAISWDSGWVVSDRSTFLPYEGPRLSSRSCIAWRVNYLDQKGREGGWSEWATCEVGLLSSADWTAQWMRPSDPSDPKAEPVAYMRRSFPLDRPVSSARLYVTARGVFELSLNDARVGRDHFANGFTSYKHRLDTLTYDVTGQLKVGDNRLEAMLAKGWYAGRLGWFGLIGVYGNDPALLVQLEIEYQDGTRAVITSDQEWEATWRGPVISSSLYDGEHFDARKPVEGWKPVAVESDLGLARLCPKPFPPVREIQTIAAKSVAEPKPGVFVFDLGQNMVGWARVRIPAEKDKTVTLRFAEMLKTDGMPYNEAYRSAKCVDSYTAATTGTITWEPRFTFRGFRYVELSGLPAGAEPELSWVTGVVLHSDLRPTGVFVSSHPKLNQLQSNIAWSQRGNFLDIPTDCPQRDERMGWTGDAQVFVGTSMFNYDSHAFWKSWLATMRDDQLQDGQIPHVVPHAVLDGGCPGWVEAAIVVSWEVYVRTGDLAVLAENYRMMERLAEWYRTKTIEGVAKDTWFVGDWLQPYAPQREGETSHTLIGAAHHARTVEMLSWVARALCRTEEAKRYAEESQSLGQAFAAKYFDSHGRVQNAPETQTSYLLAIAFDLIPEEMKEQAAAHLVRLIHAADDHLRTGFLGTPHIIRVLDEVGYTDLAMKVLLNETYPSWFYSINQGATTLWERWNSYSHEHGFGDVEMNSFNHYAYGAIGQWLYERLAGLEPDAAHPGYKHFFLRPLVAGPLTSVSAELETPYGTAFSGWTREGRVATLSVVVPPNTTATLVFPDGQPTKTLQPGKHQFTCKLPDSGSY